MPQPPANAFPPGTPLTVGTHQIKIRKYISEGGFAHVYSCTISPPFNGNTTACLKRVVVPNKWQLTLLRQEVDAMKRLRGNANIVSYIDSHASRLPPVSAGAPQQYEVLLLMEFCEGNGLIDFMNTRLTNRLTEPEILSIMGQVTAAVAMCHHLAPPLIHRDIKIENVLIDGKGTYKLCDFGSAVEYSKPPGSPAETAALHADIMQNTTPQYRAPEMIDLSHGFPIDDKSDIWALGVFLYKLCYYTTPFESPHQKSLDDLHAQILNCSATLRFPNSPHFSARLQKVIHCCLRADPRRRPNALQLLQEVCLMQNISVIPDVVPHSVRLAKESAAVNTLQASRPQPTKQIQAGVTDKIDASKKHPEQKRPLPELVRPQTMEQKPELPARRVQPAKTPTDAFAKIDKSKLLSMGKPRPKSEIYPSNSSISLHEYVKLQVSEASEGGLQPRKSEDPDRSTLRFLRSREAEESHSRQNTGGSLKASIKNGLRRISTGGSLSSQRSGSFTTTKISNGSEKESSDGHLKLPGQEAPKRMNSIQRRVQQLLNNKEKKAPKTAAGYGKYTEQDDISAINFNNLSAHASMESLSSTKSEQPSSFVFNQKSGNKLDARETKSKPAVSSHANEVAKKKDDSELVIRPLPKTRRSYISAAPPPCPPSLSVRNSSTSLSTRNNKPEIVAPGVTQGQSVVKKKAPPPKPTKPQHLKKPSDRRLSTSSEVSMPDLDDLERQFARRFPSYV